MRQDVDLIVAPYHVGHHRVSMGLGPETILARGAVESLNALGYRTGTDTVHLDPEHPNDVLASFNLQRLLSDQVRATIKRQAFPIALTGNCNTAAIGMIGGLPRDIGIIWFDCHADFETPETTLSGFQDDMGLAIATGYCWQALREHVVGAPVVPDQNVILVGTRDYTDSEERRLDESAIAVISPKHAGVTSPGSELERALGSLASRVEGVYVHVDMDVLDLTEGRANAFATPGGLSVAGLTRAIAEVGAAIPIRGAAITSYDPAEDTELKVADAALRVLESLATSARNDA